MCDTNFNKDPQSVPSGMNKNLCITVDRDDDRDPSVFADPIKPFTGDHVEQKT